MPIVAGAWGQRAQLSLRVAQEPAALAPGMLTRLVAMLPQGRADKLQASRAAERLDHCRARLRELVKGLSLVAYEQQASTVRAVHV